MKKEKKLYRHITTTVHCMHVHPNAWHHIMWFGYAYTVTARWQLAPFLSAHHEKSWIENASGYSSTVELVDRAANSFLRPKVNTLAFSSQRTVSDWNSLPELVVSTVQTVWSRKKTTQLNYHWKSEETVYNPGHHHKAHVHLTWVFDRWTGLTVLQQYKYGYGVWTNPRHNWWGATSGCIMFINISKSIIYQEKKSLAIYINMCIEGLIKNIHEIMW